MGDAIPVSVDLTLGRLNATPEVRETPGCSQIPCNVPTALGWGDAVGDTGRTTQGWVGLSWLSNGLCLKHH